MADTKSKAEIRTMKRFGHPSALLRKDIKRGTKVAIVDENTNAVIWTGKILSLPFTLWPTQAEPEDGRLVMIQRDHDGEPHPYTLYELGVEPDDKGEYTNRVLLDAQRAERLTRYGGSPDANDPPER